MRRAQPPRRCTASWRPSATHAVAGMAAGGGTLESGSRSQQRQRQNDLFGRHSAVQERAAIPALIFAQLRRVNEEAVTGREQRVRAVSFFRQLDRFLAGKEQRLLRTLRAEILAEL